MKEAKKYGQMLATAEVIMKSEINKRSLGSNKAQKKRAAEGSKEIRTDAPNSGGHYEKWQQQAEPRLQKEMVGGGSKEIRTDAPNSRGHYEK